MDVQPVYALEVTDVSGNKFESVMKCGGRDLGVRIRENAALFFKVSPDFAEHTGRGRVEGEDCYSWKNPLLNIPQVSIASRGAVRPLEELSNADSACELVLARDGTDPLDVDRMRMRTKKLRDRVRVEEEGHGKSIEVGRGPSSDTA
jgi:hypothetical protein